MRTRRSFEKYAREAQLWPHEEIFGEDQVLRGVKFYVTDGSFAVNTTEAKDIITSEQTLRILVRELDVSYLCRVIPPLKYGYSHQ
jgi:hypothetical protein